MTHDSHEPNVGGTLGGETPSQGNFMGGLGLGLLIFMALFTLFILGSAAIHGFQ